MQLMNPWTLSALIAMVVAFYASARSLQLGPAIAVVTFTSLTGNIVALLGGILVFHDPIGHTPPQIAARIAAFCLVILGAALRPDGSAPARRPPPTLALRSPRLPSGKVAFLDFGLFKKIEDGAGADRARARLSARDHRER